MLFVTPSVEMMRFLLTKGGAVLFIDDVDDVMLWNFLFDVARQRGYETLMVASGKTVASKVALRAMTDAFALDDHVTLVVPLTNRLDASQVCKQWWARDGDVIDSHLDNSDRIQTLLIQRNEGLDVIGLKEETLCLDAAVFALHLHRSQRFAPVDLFHSTRTPSFDDDQFDDDQLGDNEKMPGDDFVRRMLAANVPVSAEIKFFVETKKYGFYFF